MRDERLDARPVDDLARRDAPADAARQQASQRHTRAGVYRDHLPRTVDVCQLDLIGTDQPRPLEVDQVSGAQVLRQQHLSRSPLEPLEANYPGEVATRYRYRDGAGELGVIASVTQPFCGACTRARLSADGKLYTCLFATRGHDLRELLRGDACDDELTDRIRSIWSKRADRYSDRRHAATRRQAKIEMSYIGG